MRFVLGVLTAIFAASCPGDSAGDTVPAEAGHSDPVALQQSRTAVCSPEVRCFRDTAVVRDLPYEPGSTVDADWIVFGAERDSLEIDAGVGDSTRYDAYVGAVHAGRVIQERNAAGNTAAWVRLRLQHAGVVRVHVSLNEIHGDTIPYLFRIGQIRADFSSWATATGFRASLTLIASDSVLMSVIPMSSAASRTDFENWAVPPREYRVALVADSLYVVCRLPCKRRDTVSLRPGVPVTRRY